MGERYRGIYIYKLFLYYIKGFKTSIRVGRGSDLIPIAITAGTMPHCSTGRTYFQVFSQQLTAFAVFLGIISLLVSCQGIVRSLLFFLAMNELTKR